MTRVRTVVAAIVALGAGLAAGAPRVAAGAAGAGGRAAPDEELNDQGVELRRKGEDKAALDVFQKAYDLTHSPRATAQLGLAYQALGRWELAGPLLDKALQSPGDPWIKKYTRPLQEAHGVIKQHLARIELTGEPDGAEVIVNGVAAGRLPLPAPLTVSVGTVDLQVRAAGFRDDIRKVTVTPYQYEHLFVRLDRLPEAVATTPPPVAKVVVAAADEGPTKVEVATPPPAGGARESEVSPRAIAKWSALGLAVAGLGTGVTASIIHSQKLTDFSNADGGQCSNNNGKAVDMTTGAAVRACQPALDAIGRTHTWQIIGFAAAGAFAVTWLVLQLTEPAAPSKATATAAAWSCAPSLVRPGAECALRF